jgi:hypothetical protein
MTAAVARTLARPRVTTRCHRRDRMLYFKANLTIHNVMHRLWILLKWGLTV